MSDLSAFSDLSESDIVAKLGLDRLDLLDACKALVEYQESTDLDDEPEDGEYGDGKRALLACPRRHRQGGRRWSMTTNTITPAEERLGLLRRLEQDARSLAESLRPLDDSFGLWGPYHHALNCVRSITAMIGEAERKLLPKPDRSTVCPGYETGGTGPKCCARAGGYGSDGPLAFHYNKPNGCGCHD